MTQRQFEKKVRAVLAEIAAGIVPEAIRLYRSGGIDPKEWANDEHALAKLVTIVAVENTLIKWRPVLEDHLLEMKNLRKF